MRLLLVRHAARPAGRADHGHHGLGLPGLAARHLRPRPREPRRPCSTAHRILHRPGLNEELAAATVWGSQMGAVVAYRGRRRRRRGLVRQDARARPVRRRARSTATPWAPGPNGGVVLFCGDDPDGQVVDADLRQPVHVRGRLHPGAVPGRPAGRPRPRRPRLPPVPLRRVLGRAQDRDRRWPTGSGTVVADLDRHRPPAQPGDLDHRRRAAGATSRCATIGPHAVPDQEVLVVDAPAPGRRRPTSAHNGPRPGRRRARPARGSASSAPARPTSTWSRPSPTSGSRSTTWPRLGRADPQARR